MDPSSGLQRVRGPERFNEIRGVKARPAGIEPATPCLEGIVTASFLSIGYLQFFALSTTWGTCSPLTSNPNPFNKQGF